jgi:ADP-ribose pyrophosphatase
VSTDRHEGLHEDLVSGEMVYEGVLLRVRRDAVRLPDGETASREYIVHPGAAVIVPVLPDGRLLFERQYRHAHGRVFVEFPAGKREPGEEMLETAKRELLEETGYRAGRWTSLARVHPALTYTTELLELFVAEGLEFVGRRLDDGEFVETFGATLDEALGWIDRGELTDAKTLVGLLLYARGR